ncbi:SIS domain-containing protein [Calidifontibacter sp. DB0510]|uniref:SIS domain-containing protein n=1 Tax=Metallococcus carri TaxID=1656884 RepID=A0A967EDP9_9MICO|nr:SIS domain-containing protein [Metallococcus carri]NHN54946.1 SIS domain-containing protein [Metallococcus carri]NOP37292.1 SIS domain-containing protein [Calidifontibacter sp. DB2511S]
MSHPIHGVDPQAAGAAVTRRYADGLASWSALAAALTDPALTAAVDAAGAAFVERVAAGGTVLVAGNGGSAAMASHIAAELVGKCVHDNPPLPAISLAESISSLTAIGNDYGYDEVFNRGILAHARAGDVFLAMSTSGSSPNIVSALALARERGVLTIAMVGEGGRHLQGSVDHLLVVPSRETPRIQEVHLLWGHSWCEAIDVLSRDAGDAGS